MGDSNADTSAQHRIQGDDIVETAHITKKSVEPQDKEPVG